MQPPDEELPHAEKALHTMAKQDAFTSALRNLLYNTTDSCFHRGPGRRPLCPLAAAVDDAQRCRSFRRLRDTRPGQRHERHVVPDRRAF
eukprot:418719-Prymnesium_polylepis.1